MTSQFNSRRNFHVVVTLISLGHMSGAALFAQPALEVGSLKIVSVVPEPPGLPHPLHIGEKLLSGGEPRGDLAFAELKRRGVKTIISVDGAVPDLAAAKKYSLRYIHIPIGYDGIPRTAQESLTAVARTAEWPFYIHCHHGKHRGPAAAAILIQAMGDCQSEAALKILEQAGTNRNYAGLFRDVAAFHPIPADAKLPELVEVAKLDSLTVSMAKIDRHWDHLKLCQQANWKAPKKHADLDPAREALLMREAFREANRTLHDRFDDSFRKWLIVAESQATTIEDQLRSGARDDLNRLMKQFETSCQSCHETHRR